MGAQQSTGHDSTSPGNPGARTCYYEVLGVERQATEDEIKKGYRKKALELHPDRNFGNAEEATAKFAEVSSAYEVLSDPQERAWYDSHRDSILRGDGGGAEKEDHFEQNVRVTSAAALVALMGRFNSRTLFTDAPTGFYGILQETFSTLAKEEDLACEWQGIERVDYPDFGGAKDDYEDAVKLFYRAWINFSTKKSFSWRDQYRVSEGPDRAMRRLMEKENRRLRDEGIREFNDAVRSLVTFVRKRDPRFTPNTQTEADRQKLIREAAAAQAARSRAANRAKLDTHVTPIWAQTQKTEEEDKVLSSGDESIMEHIECVVCNKTFKSEKQYEAHEKSKKHTKAVQQLRRHMQAENKYLDLDSPSATAEPDRLSLKSEEDTARSGRACVDSTEEEGRSVQADVKKDTLLSKPPNSVLVLEPAETPPSESSDLESDYAPRETVEDRLSGALGNSVVATENSVTSEDGNLPKLGKAKAKRAKRLARQEIGSQDDSTIKCILCNEKFVSRNQLFGHINKTGHVEPIPKGRGGKNKNR